MTLPTLSLFLVLLVAWLSGRLAERLGSPAVMGELIAGIVLGPPILGWLSPEPALAVLAQVGILLMMAYIGMEIDPAALGRATRAGIWTALGGFFLPFFACYAFTLWMGETTLAALFVGMAAGVTALAVKSRILYDLKMLDTRISNVMMAGSLVTDILSLLIFAGIIGLADRGSVGFTDLAIVAGKAAVFLVSTAAIGHFLFPHIGKMLSRGRALGPGASFIAAVILILAFSELSELAGLHAILGAFMAGLYLRNHLFARAQTRALEEGLRQASIGFLAPIFFVTVGFGVSVDVIHDAPFLLFSLLLIASVGKIVGTVLFYLPTGYGWREGVVIGAAMNGRGVVEIIVAQIGLSMGLISQEIFSVLVFMAIATTATVPYFLQKGVQWLERNGQLVRADEGRNGTLIVGAGPTARAFAALLLRAEGCGPVRLIDRNAEACAAARALRLEVTEGDAMDEDVLASAGAAKVRSLVALTPNPEVNALVSRLAQTSFRIPSILVHQEGRWTGSADPSTGHDAVLEHTGATTAFGTPFHLSDWDYWFENGRTEVSTHSVEAEIETGNAVRELAGAAPALAFLVRRDTHAFPVGASTLLHPGDRITIVSRRADSVVEAPDFATLLRSAPIVIDAGALDRNGLFLLAAERLAETTGLAPATLSRGFLDREESGSTVIADGIAVPHAHLPGVDRVAFVVVRSVVGIRFDDLPAPVYAALVIATSDDRRTEYLRTLASIARAVSAPGFLGRWKAADSAEAIRGLLGGG